MVSRRLIFAFAIAVTPLVAAAASLDASIGQRLFERNWISAPSSTKSDDGLGPLYDAPSCASCHAQREATELDETTVPPGVVVRLGNARGSGDPVYGRQLQTRAVVGHMPEANPDIAWTARGALRIATVTLYSQAYGKLANDTKIALRRAPSVFGVGILAHIPESEIVKAAEQKRDGVSGRPAWLLENGRRVLGRFGWRATQPDLTAQISMAFSNDIGLSTALHPEPWGDCTAAETVCRAGPHGAEKSEVEVPPALVAMIADYLNNLRPAAAPRSPRGEAVFNASGCVACHATLHLADGRAVSAYTDLLLHDMGPGLNDGIKEGAAEPGEWRTAPLWNVAATLKMGGLLHDARARNVAEAVTWHDGEAAAARNRFEALTPADKAALIDFVSKL